jgi:hypothetical protein
MGFARTSKERFVITLPAALNCTIKFSQVKTCMRSHLTRKKFMRRRAERYGRCLFLTGGKYVHKINSLGSDEDQIQMSSIAKRREAQEMLQ